MLQLQRVALMSAGASNQMILGIPLPLSLDFAGMRGCFLYHSCDVAWLVPVQTGIGQFSAQVPNNPILVGSKVYFQSAAGNVVSNGGEAQIGIR